MQKVRVALPPAVVVGMLAMLVGGFLAQREGWVWLAITAPLVLLALLAEVMVAEWRGATTRRMVAWTAGWAALLWLGPAFLISPLVPLVLVLLAVIPIYGLATQPLAGSPVAQAWQASAPRYRGRAPGSIRAQVLGFLPILAGLAATSFGLLGVAMGSLGAMSIATLHPNAIYAGPIFMLVGVALLFPTVFVVVAPFIAPFSDPPHLRRLRASMGIEGATRWDTSTAFGLAIVDASLLVVMMVWVTLMVVGVFASGATSTMCFTIGAAGIAAISLRNVVADCRLFAPASPARSVVWAIVKAPRSYAEANLWEGTVLTAVLVPTILAVQAIPIAMILVGSKPRMAVVAGGAILLGVLWAGAAGWLALRFRMHRAQLVQALLGRSDTKPPESVS